MIIGKITDTRFIGIFKQYAVEYTRIYTWDDKKEEHKKINWFNPWELFRIHNDI